jgi:hypothetical protein
VKRRWHAGNFVQRIRQLPYQQSPKFPAEAKKTKIIVLEKSVDLRFFKKSRLLYVFPSADTALLGLSTALLSYIPIFMCVCLLSVLSVCALNRRVFMGIPLF